PVSGVSHVVKAISTSIFVDVTIKISDIVFGIRDKLDIKGVLIGFAVKQDVVIHAAISSRCVAVATCALPNDVTAKILWAKDGIHQQLQIVAGGGVAVEV